MSTSYIQRQKIRSWQIFLLTLGGVLMFWGFLLYQEHQDKNQGYQALHKERFVEALQSFEDDISGNPDRLESRVGRGLALLQLERGLEAEAEHAYVYETVDEGERTPASRQRVWKDRNPREWSRFKGYFLHFNAWIYGERLLRGYRIKESTSLISERISDYERERKPFVSFVKDKESAKDNAEYWSHALTALTNRINQADRTDALTRAAKQLKNALILKENTPAQLEAAFSPSIERAVREAPESIPARTWHLLLLGELSSRRVDLQDGRSPNELLRQSFKAGLQLEEKRHEAATTSRSVYTGLTKYQTAHFLVSLSFAAVRLQNYDQPNKSYYRDNLKVLLDRAQDAMQDLTLDTTVPIDRRDALYALYQDVIEGSELGR